MKTQTARSTGDNGDLSLEREEGLEVLELNVDFGHDADTDTSLTSSSCRVSEVPIEVSIQIRVAGTNGIL